MTRAQAHALSQAWSALQAGQPHAAAAACRRVLDADSTVFDAWRLLAMAHDGKGDAATALNALRHAHALRPDDAACALDLGTALLHAGDAAAARPLLQRASDAPAQDARAAFRLGQCCAALAEVPAARAAFAAATVRDPGWTEAWTNLAVMQHRGGDGDAALASAERALALAPEDVEVQRTLSALMSHRFDTASLERGRAHAAFVLRRDPAHAHAHADAAILARKAGDLPAACAHAREAQRLLPGHAPYVVLLGDTLALAHAPEEAVRTYADALARGVDGDALQRQYAIALLQAGDAGRALPVLEGCVRRDPADQRAIAHLGTALALCGRVDEAVERLGVDRHVQAIELPVPEGFVSRAAFHDSLANDVSRHRRQRWEPAGLAARGAFLSGELTDDGTPAIRAFDALLDRVLQDVVRTARQRARAGVDDLFLRTVPADATRRHTWATLAPAAGHIDTHIHEDSWLSGAYYVRVPPAIVPQDPQRAGWIEFGRPFASLPPVADALLRHACPRPGLLLLFPSYLFHRTRPFTGPGERISLSFDLAAA